MLVPTDERYLKELKSESVHYGNRVIFHNPVEVSEIPLSISKFDLGIYLIPPLSINNSLALPNKFFEFIQGRLGLIVGPAPEMADIVLAEGIGVVLPEYDHSINSVILNKLLSQDILSFKANSHRVAFKYSWDSEVNRLFKLL
jgi:glycosyltransferase involved in cell wall biosynthesis